MLQFFATFYFKFYIIISPKRGVRSLLKLFCTPIVNKKHKEKISGNTISIVFQGKKIELDQWVNTANSSGNILLVHGWQGNKRNFSALKEILFNDGHTVYCLDLPAHGNSEGKQTSIFECSELLAKIIQELNIKNIIGHSFGGAVSMYAISKYNVSISKMILVGSPNSTEKIFIDFTKFLSLSDRTIKHLRQEIETTFGTRIENAGIEKISNSLSISELIIIHDKFDSIVPFESALAMHIQFKNSKLIEINDTGHYKILKNNTFINTITQLFK